MAGLKGENANSLEKLECPIQSSLCFSLWSFRPKSVGVRMPNEHNNMSLYKSDICEGLQMLFLFLFLPFVFSYCVLLPVSKENLRAALASMGVGGHPLDDVMDKARDQQRRVVFINLSCSYNLLYLLSFSSNSLTSVIIREIVS